MTTEPILPPDPEGMNEERADWAQTSLEAFMTETRQGDEAEALGDLIVDLHHLADRMGLKWRDLLTSAAECYAEETDPEGA